MVLRSIHGYKKSRVLTIDRVELAHKPQPAPGAPAIPMEEPPRKNKLEAGNISHSLTNFVQALMELASTPLTRLRNLARDWASVLGLDVV